MLTAKRVIFHVGIHKTGSTSIQAFLGKNRAIRNVINICEMQRATLALEAISSHSDYAFI
jgi:hypothetical protein